MKYTHLAYASFDDIVHYLAAGWHITNDMSECPTRGVYGVLVAIETDQPEIETPAAILAKRKKIDGKDNGTD